MLKFIRGKSQHPSTERIKIQNELFGYTKTVQHGFPHKPTAMAYDPALKLMAIGTQTGGLKVFGQPGVEFYGQHMNGSNGSFECSVQLLEWIQGTGRIISLTGGRQLTLWTSEGTILNRLKSIIMEGKLKKVSCLCISISKDWIWVGTECGSIRQISIKSFEMGDLVINQDIVLEKLSQSYKLNPGAIENIQQLPHACSKLLVAYNRGLCILWDLSNDTIVKTFISSGHGETMGFFLNPCGSSFTWYHADGSFATWIVDSDQPATERDYVPYGPDPCKGITKLVKGLRGITEVTIFSGGMPRSAYGDRNSVSIHCKEGPKICLDFTSKVVDFIVTFVDSDPEQVDVLVVLLEEELCAFDLSDPDLAPVKVPYLHSIHASAITCNYLVSDVEPEIYAKLESAGQLQALNFSQKEWPINGGICGEPIQQSGKFEILITGHEDGSVKFWDCSGIVLKPLFHFKTAGLFGLGEQEQQNDNLDIDESEPPFRKAGQFDPYSDDPRLAVKKVVFCPKNGTFIVAGTAGHIIISNLEVAEDQNAIHVSTINLVNDRDGFVWKGHDELKINPDLSDKHQLTDNSTVTIVGIVQVLPPAAITCLALQTDYNLVAAGTAHGLVLYDYEAHHPVLSRCTLNPNDLTGAGEHLSRRKSFKKTLRESFRRLRKGRSMRTNQNSTRKNMVETKSIERQVEARPVDDALGSMVRCLVFGNTFITNVHSTVPTLWMATNSSCVSIFILHIPKRSCEGENNTKVVITAQLAKEIQMKHRAPVIGIVLFDQTGAPLDSQTSAGLHRVLIASEEQFKVFALPHLKPVTKYKLTAHEGARVRRLALAHFSCQLNYERIHIPNIKQSNVNVETGSPVVEENCDHNYSEFALVCLTNLGDCLVLSIPELKRQLNVAAIRREDISGISSLCFTSSGEALFMISSSELQRISLSRTKIVIPSGKIDTEEIMDHEDNKKLFSHSSNPLISAMEEAEVTKEELQNGNKDDEANCESLLNSANETLGSQVGDITVDSVRDHLNSTTTTLCSTTEDIITKLSISNTQTKSTIISTDPKDVIDLNNAHTADLPLHGKTTETETNSVIIRSLIATMSQTTPNKESGTFSKALGTESSF